MIFLFQGKLDMLENLLEIEVAYSLLKSANDGGDDGKSKDPIHAHYEKLKTDIKVVEFLAKLLDIDLNCQDKQVIISTPTIIWRTPSQASSSNSTANSTSTLATFNALIQEQLF